MRSKWLFISGSFFIFFIVFFLILFSGFSDYSESLYEDFFLCRNYLALDDMNKGFHLNKFRDCVILSKLSLDSSFVEYKKTYMKQQIHQNKIFVRHLQVSLWLQIILTIFISIVVFILVLGGFYISYLQFQKSSDVYENNLEISANGIKISSSVIGLVILSISLGFFYLFIVEVYQIDLLSIGRAHPSNDDTPSPPGSTVSLITP